jgi:hypothetical protein
MTIEVTHGQRDQEALIEQRRLAQASKELRAGIDTETVRALQLINGGMAAGLITMLPTIVHDPGYKNLGLWMLAAVACAAAGLVSATIHNHFRRHCSLAHDSGHGYANPYTALFMVFWQSRPGETRVCTKSNMAMWISLILFVIGASLVGCGFLQVEATPAPMTAPCWELNHINDHIYKFNRCTGIAETYTGK